MLKLNQVLLCVASFAFVTIGSVAHASFILCTGEGEHNEESPFEGWGAICAGDEAVYADIQVAPHTFLAGDTIAVHVTDHLDCPGDMRLQCGLSTSFEQNYECFEEREPWEFEPGGFSTWAFVWCGCYAPDEDCHS